MNPFTLAEKTGVVQRQAWMIIFADLLALLLTFFVLIYSMNAVQYEDWQSVVDSLAQELNTEDAHVADDPEVTREATRIYRPVGIGLDYLSAVLEQKTAGDPVLGASLVARLDDRLIISLPNELVFEGQSEVLTAEGRATIAELASLFGQLSNQVSISVHSDLSPPDGALYASNWHFTLSRALSVRDVLVEAGYRQAAEALGMGASRFSDIDPGLALAERYRLARRVDVIIREKMRLGISNAVF